MCGGATTGRRTPSLQSISKTVPMNIANECAHRRLVLRNALAIYRASIKMRRFDNAKMWKIYVHRAIYAVRAAENTYSAAARNFSRRSSHA